MMGHSVAACPWMEKMAEGAEAQADEKRGFA